MNSDLESLWVQNQPLIERYLLRRCQCPELAADLSAETFIHAATALRRNDSITINSGWLVTVAHRRLMDHWRRSYREERIREIQTIAFVRIGMEPEVRVSAELSSALARLCPTQRNALVLRYALDQPVDRVADHLDLTYRAAESVLMRAKRRLAKELQAAHVASQLTAADTGCGT